MFKVLLLILDILNSSESAVDTSVLVALSSKTTMYFFFNLLMNDQNFQ